MNPAIYNLNVIPAKAGVSLKKEIHHKKDSCLRRNDNIR